jgi:hypothetical protein
MRRLFIAHTTGHLLSAWAIALSSSELCESHLWFLEDVMRPRCEPLSDGHPFAEVTVFPGLHGARSLGERRRRVRRNCRSLEAASRLLRPDEVYVFNDSRPEIQACLCLASDLTPAPRCIHIQDGAGLYSTYVRGGRSRAAIALGRIFYGAFFTDVPVHGTSPWISEIRAAFPACVRPELRAMHAERIPFERLTALSQTLLDAVFPALRSSTFAIPAGAIVIAAPHPDLPVDGITLASVMGFLQRAMTERGIPFVLKPHPAIGSPTVPPGPFFNTPLLEAETPLEALLLAARHNIRALVGVVSTSLIMARCLVPEIPVISLAGMLGLEDRGLLQTFESLGVAIPRDEVALCRFLDESGARGL